MRRLAALCLAASATLAAGVQPGADRDVRAWMARAADRVQAYYARAQHIICEETVRLEPLGPDLMRNGDHVRELVYELRVSWEQAEAGGAPPEATVLRQLLKVDGRPPRPGDEPGCFDPPAASPAPLNMLLPHRQAEFVFSWGRAGREGDRRAVAIDYQPARPGKPVLEPKGEHCFSIELPGRSRGRLWLDEATGDVLRLDEHLSSQVDVPVPPRPREPFAPLSITVERADSSIVYAPVVFHDPDETLLLPASIVSLQVIRNSGVPRLRISQRFSNYRRFITGGRIVQ
jgi:hypothetical protein